MNSVAKKYFIIFVALSGIILNSLYGIELLTAFFDPIQSSEIRKVLVSAIVLEFGWIALLIWMAFDPFKRRDILLLSIIPILFGNILHNIDLILLERSNMIEVVINLAFGIFYSGVYLFAYILGKGK